MIEIIEPQKEGGKPNYETLCWSKSSLCYRSFSVHLFSKKREIILKGVSRVFEGCCKVFERYLEKLNRGMKSVRPPRPVYKIISQMTASLMGKK